MAAGATPSQVRYHTRQMLRREQKKLLAEGIEVKYVAGVGGRRGFAPHLKTTDGRVIRVWIGHMSNGETVLSVK